MIYDDMRAQLDSALRDRDAMGAALTRADEYAAAALARAEAAERELHQWRTGHHLSEYQEALNEMQGRAVDAEAKLAAAEATIARVRELIRLGLRADEIEAALAGPKDGE